MKVLNLESRTGENFRCDCCGVGDAPTRLYDASYRPGRPAGTHKDRLCEVCAGTFIGNAWQYPHQHDNVILYQALAQCIHIVLREIRQRKVKR